MRLTSTHCKLFTDSRTSLASLPAVLVLLGSTGSASGQCDEAVLLATATGDEGLGVACDVDGDLAVLGAYHADNQAANAGAASVFRRTESGWVEEIRLLELDASTFSGAFDVLEIAAREVVHHTNGGAPVHQLD